MREKNVSSALLLFLRLAERRKPEIHNHENIRMAKAGSRADAVAATLPD
jgi:hypothetical protein